MRILHEVLVLNLDGVPDSQGEVFDKATLTFREDVWVTKDYKRPDLVSDDASPSDLWGTAFLYLGKDSNLYADITLYDHVPGPITVFPGVGGSTKERKGNVLGHVEVYQIGLHVAPNADSRIPSINVPALPGPDAQDPKTGEWNPAVPLKGSPGFRFTQWLKDLF